MPTSDFFSKFTPNRNENENSMHRVSNETHLPLVGLCDHSRYLSISYALHVGDNQVTRAYLSQIMAAKSWALNYDLNRKQDLALHGACCCFRCNGLLCMIPPFFADRWIEL